jgi:hypothetical protein
MRLRPGADVRLSTDSLEKRDLVLNALSSIILASALPTRIMRQKAVAARYERLRLN